jgi:hypothetical protein
VQNIRRLSYQWIASFAFYHDSLTFFAIFGKNENEIIPYNITLSVCNELQLK